MTKIKSKYLIFGALIIIIIAAIVAWLLLFKGQNSAQKIAVDQFVQCLKDKDAVLYGAFWCSHCKNQKKIFGSSADLLPYVECSTPDGNSQLTICQEKNIENYPTWIFADNARIESEMSFKQLSDKTDCPLP